MLNLTKIQESKIISQYQLGNSTITLQKIHGISRSTISRMLRKRHIKIRNKNETNKKFITRSNYFKKINSHAKAYILGLLITDGYNNEKHGYIQFGLHIKDKSIVEYVNNLLHKNYRPLYLKKGGNFIHTCITDKQLSVDLARLGCIQNKSLTVRLPNIDKKFVNSLILGCFDGDGCIYLGKLWQSNKFIITSGSEKFCQDLQKRIKTEVKIMPKVYSQQGQANVIWSLVVHRKQDLKKIREWIYRNQQFYLKRKKIKFDLI